MVCIFDLDGTLADCEHRRHFVDAFAFHMKHLGTLKHHEKYIPDWKSFYEACDKDEPINETCKIFDDLAVDNEIEIWSGRCESVREKTIKWLYENIPYSGQKLKMRPIGDNTPDDILKERWLDEYIKSMWPKLPAPNEENKEKVFYRKNPIDFVFDDRPKVIRMWRRRGIFVFNCCQHDKEF